MAHLVSLTDGTTTISLADGSSCFVERYTPATPEVDEATRTRAVAGVNGTELAGVALRNVTESMDLLLRAASVAALQALVRSIEAMLATAHRRAHRRVGAQVFLQLQLDGEASAWRSEVLTGRLVLDEDGLGWWPNKAVRGQLIVQRRPFWEGAEVELELSNSNQAAATGGRTIYNHDDSGTGHDNWVQIAAAQVTGALPAPVRVELKNTTAAAVAFSTIYLATNAFGDPTTFIHMIEGESRISGGTVTVNADSSNGSFNVFTFTNTGSIVYTLLTMQQVRNANGRSWRLLARTVLFSANTFVTPILRTGTLEVWRGAETLLGSQVWMQNIKDWGSLPLPPAELGSTAAGALQLVLELRCSSGSGSLTLDFMQLTPTDSLRRLKLPYVPVAQNDTIVDDGIFGNAYYVLSGEKYPGVTAEGEPLLVFPGLTQRVMVLHDEDGMDVEIARTLSVRIYYRPRRLTV